MVQIQDLIISKEMQMRSIEEDAKKILQPFSNLKINQETEEECEWDVFIEEILPRLPANQLQTLKTVCKNWNRIISSPYFVQLHLNIYNQNLIGVVVPQWNSEMMIEYKYNNYRDKEETKLQIRHPPAVIRKRTVPTYILGSCDGLLCLRFGDTITVYNPSTGKYFGVEPVRDFFNININICWFGQHSGEYVLVLGDFNQEIGVFKFSRSSDVFELIQSTCCCIDPQDWGNICCSEPRRGTLLHGALHWPASWHSRHHGIPTRYVICAYRLQNNKYLEISPPVVRDDFKLGVAQGCLFAIFMSDVVGVFEMWMMKEYGVQQSWTKYANIHGFKTYDELSPLGLLPNGDLVLDDVDNRKVFKYSFSDHKLVLLMNRDYGIEAILCADSLVSPTIVYT